MPAARPTAAFGDGARLRRAPRDRAPGTSRSRSLGDGTGAVSHLHDRGTAASSAATRSWSRSRRRPACSDEPAGPRSHGAAVRLAGELALPRSLGTFEFLVDPDAEPTGVRVHRGQRPPAGRAHRHRGDHRASTSSRPSCAWPAAPRLAELGLDPGPHPGAPRASPSRRGSTPRRCSADGTTAPSGGTHRRLRAARPAPGIRVDSVGYAGYRLNPRYDSLLAKVIGATARARPAAVAPAAAGRSASCGSRAWPPTSRFLVALLQHPELAAGDGDDHASSTTTWPSSAARQRRRRPAPTPTPTEPGRRAPDRADPLAVLDLGKSPAPVASTTGPRSPRRRHVAVRRRGRVDVCVARR